MTVNMSQGLGSKFKELIASWKRILQLSRRPDREEFSLLLKLNLLGFTLIGAIAYLIHIIATVFVPAIVR